MYRNGNFAILFLRFQCLPIENNTSYMIILF